MKYSETNLNPAYTFENFKITKGNRPAFKAVIGMAKNNENILLLHGKTGTGKTHLLISFLRLIIKERPKARILYIAANDFITEFINSIRHRQTDKFYSTYSKLDYFLLDDIDFLEGKPETQAELISIINKLYINGKKIIISSTDSSMKKMSLHEKLRSRLKWGLVIEIKI